MFPTAGAKILLTLESFKNLTGSELYVYELARELLLCGHNVTIAAPKIGGEIVDRTVALGAAVTQVNDKGTYIWPRFDVVHTAQPAPTRWALKHFPNTPIICTVHSPLHLEAPVLDPRIKHYICVRPEVQAKLIVVDEIAPAKTSVIYNPINFERFVDISWPATKRMLFCGTIDNIRKATIQHLLAMGGIHRLLLVGEKTHTYDGYIDVLPAWAEWYPSTWNIEQYIAQCTETASVFMGRTTIEGWLANRPCWVSEIDETGNIQSFSLHEKPSWISLFDSSVVAAQVLGVYAREVA